MTGPPQIRGIEIEREIGRGAHSVVFRANQDGVRCAVKLPRVKARWTRWIYREAVALARVRHPHLPGVLEVGEVEGLPYLVMDLVEGTTLAERLVEGALAEHSAIAIGRQLAGALEAVHAAGLVHRDVKPRNIVLDRHDQLKLVDFGFATPMERAGSDGAGTAAYAAPEQLASPGRVDGRADLFATGRVLFECLTGQSPGRGDAPIGHAARTRLLEHGVSPCLAQAVAGLLEQEPGRRYPSAGAFLSDLELAGAGRGPLGPSGYRAGVRPVRLIGRREECDSAVLACRDLSNGSSLILVRGKRGAGKSVFLAGIQDEVRAFANVVAISAMRDDPPLATLRRILETYIEGYGREVGEANPGLRAAIANLAPVARLIAPEATRRLLGDSGEHSFTVADMTSGAEAVAEGAAELLIRLAEKAGPLVVLIDDGQWIDPVSGDTLARVASRPTSAPLAMIVSGRTDLETPVFRRLSEIRGRRSLAIELGRLSRSEVHQLIEAYLSETAVDADLDAIIAEMADGTPLGVLEVLGAFLDAGVVRPHARRWRFDPQLIHRVVLPPGALVLLGRRLGELPPATMRVLEAAAVLGRRFDVSVLGETVDIEREELGFALASARRAGVLEPELGGTYTFIHDSVRELLVENLLDADLRRLHQRIGEVLEPAASGSFDQLYAAALHFAAGEPEKDPARWYRLARAAASAALARFDNETALRFLGHARTAAEAARLPLDLSFFREMGEAHLRLGALDDSLAAFDAALERAPNARVRAEISGRLSWVHQSAANPRAAWEQLEKAFAVLGRRLPAEDVGAVLATSTNLARGWVGKVLARNSTTDVDLLCELHYQNARLGIEYGKPARVILSALEARALSDRSQSTSTQARARATYGLVASALGRPRFGARELADAKGLATAHGASAAVAFCVQLQAMAASWGGDFDDALTLLRECADIHGPWLELNEYVQVVASAELLESMRGRASAAWPWSERALERLRRARAAQAVRPVVVHRARASLAALGREIVDDPWLAGELAAVPANEAGKGFHRVISWGPRARYYLEATTLGGDFEKLVEEFEAEGMDPRGVHFAVVEYYLVVAHARIHEFLHARPWEREAAISRLHRAACDVRAAAKLPLVKAHALAAEGYLAWAEGKSSAARKKLAAGEALANEQSAPWVLYAVARARAHMLREAGNEEAARDQARVAYVFAHEHGAATRARWIREEFDLGDMATAPPTRILSSRRSGSSSSRANRQLATLLQIARAPRLDLKMDEQAGAILDELIEALDAERGAILFQPEPSKSGITVARHRASEVSVSVAPDSVRGALLRDVRRRGVPWPPSDGAVTSEDDQPFDATRVIAVPLFLYEKPAGALCIERGEGHPKFEQEDRNLLLLLSHQVPIALELARVLVEREQLHGSLQHAKKMEAMGTLAGGLAHDFNNMLAAMKVALGAAQERAALDSELTVELDVIAEATTRASQLTSQLLSFSRHRPVSIGVHDVNQLISTIEPMLRRVVGAGIDVVVKLSPAVDAVEVDQGSFDQALVNLLINARDAMPKGGTLTIATRNVVLGPAAAQRANVPPGEFVEVEVSDTGTGMTTDVMSRIFEPFFTTKPAGVGSGLGLAMVYAFARNSGGSIEVSSEVGKGTQFRLYFRRAEPKRTSRPARTASSRASEIDTAKTEVKTDGPDTILVVDDDDLVRRSIAKILERHGYRVVAARGSDEALDVVKQQGGRIALVILDVLMPGISGPELGRRLSELKLPAKLLFVSGFSPESIPFDDAKVAAHMLLQKPFSQTALLERVRHLIYS